MGKVPISAVIDTLQKGFLVERRTARPVEIDPAVAAAGAALGAAINRHISTILFHGIEQASREENATQHLMYHWKITREELDERLQRIADANPGDWSDRSAHRVWVYVLAGMTFDSNGRLEIENHPMFTKPKFEFKSRFSL